MFSAVSSAFIIDVHSNLQPDPNEQSAALLQAILLALNQPAIPGETPTVPPIQEDPASEIVTATCLMYASLLISLLAAFIAMLGKQWLNRYLRHSGGSMIERCADRQQKRDGLKKWPLHPLIESLPLMLQAALLLLACGLCRYMWSINTSVAYTLIGLTALGVIFFIGIVIAGISSYACPFQTPISTALRGMHERIRRGVEQALSPVRQSRNRRDQWLLRHSSLSTISSLSGIEVQETNPWIEPKVLATIDATHAGDARCVSWIIRKITDPEALEAAVRLAGTIRWFDGPDVDVPYGSIVSMFEGCFDPSGKLYTGSRDRAYYSGRAMVWINSLAMCKSRDLARTFPIFSQKYRGPDLDPDLGHLLDLSGDRLDKGTWDFWLHTAGQGLTPYDLDEEERILQLVTAGQGPTPSHTQWTSDVLLCCSWALGSRERHERVLDSFINLYWPRTVTPLKTTLNRLLSWCILLGSPPPEEVLKVENKSYDTSCFALRVTHNTLR